MDQPQTFALDDYIPMSHWGQDHWGTFAYVDTVMVECGSFQVGRDPRMKASRRNFRVMTQECPNPKRAHRTASGLAMPMDLAHSTKLNDGQLVAGHDDYACLQDMAAEGLFLQAPNEVEPGVKLQFSPRGVDAINALRDFKRNGGQTADFRSVTTQAVAETAAS